MIYEHPIIVPGGRRYLEHVITRKGTKVLTPSSPQSVVRAMHAKSQQAFVVEPRPEGKDKGVTSTSDPAA